MAKPVLENCHFWFDMNHGRRVKNFREQNGSGALTLFRPGLFTV